MEAVELGFCACGCGKPTTIARYNDPRWGARKGEPRRFIRGHACKGERHWLWKGGRSPDGSGYTRVLCDGHPRMQGVSHYVLEHILVAEAALGHPLPPGAVVHHFDENKSNNSNSNLVVCQDEAYHHLLHARMRALLACGDPNARRCRYCRSYDNQNEIVILEGYSRVAYHRACASAVAKARKNRAKACAA